MTRTWKMAVSAALGVALLSGAATAVAAREQAPQGPGVGRRGPGGPGGPGRPGRPGGPDGAGGIMPELRGLDLTATQREQVKTTLDSHKAEFDAQRSSGDTARRALHGAVTAATFDEATIRQKAADLALVDADGAVLRGKVYSEVWALLTPEQQTRATALRSARAERAGQMRERMQQRRDQRQQARPQDAR